MVLLPVVKPEMDVNIVVQLQAKIPAKAVSGCSKEGACGIGMEMFCSEAQ